MFKYTPSAKGKKQGIVKVSLTKEKDYVMIKIKDNGIGIPEQDLLIKFFGQVDVRKHIMEE